MILVVGLSPAWQRTLTFECIVTGKVNRARRVSETASGKGVNVARVLRQLGGKVRLLTVAGGGAREVVGGVAPRQGDTGHGGARRGGDADLPDVAW